MSLPSKINSTFLSAYYILTFPTLAIHIIELSAELSAGWRRGSCSSLSASSPLCSQRLPCCWRWSEDRRGFGERRGGSADAKILYLMSVSQPFHASPTFLSKEARKGKTRSRLVFVLHSPTQREIFMRSSSEMERMRVTRTDAQRRRGNGVCVSPCESLCASTFLSYQTWWENINMLANNGHIMGAAGNIRAWW